MAPRENKNNAYAKFGGTNKEYYGIFRTGLLNNTHTCSHCLSRVWGQGALIEHPSWRWKPLGRIPTDFQSSGRVAG